MTSHKLAIIFVLNLDNFAKVCSFALYLLDIRQIDKNGNFKNECCNLTDCTKGWFYY